MIFPVTVTVTVSVTKPQLRRGSVTVPVTETDAVEICCNSTMLPAGIAR